VWPCPFWQLRKWWVWYDEEAWPMRCWESRRWIERGCDEHAGIWV
jgi:hypothetical protein